MSTELRRWCVYNDGMEHPRSSDRASVRERYDRRVSATGGDPLARLARWIRPGSTVLDVGSAAGALGCLLGSMQRCVVDGVEWDIEAAIAARPWYRQLLVADLDLSSLDELFCPGRYDCVVCADVLEHLRDPSLQLRSMHRLLAAGGRVLVSAPNATYAPLVAELLGGRL
ncbi:MAG TPA: class I SAM-dependent methyltransferase, partial [Planctomycetota bacterium]|nr:class I SAM-dependent methyltransferase [Planctomycetota bacterium]